MAHKKNSFVKLCENTGLGSGWRGENCIVEQATHSVAFDQCWAGRKKAQGRRLFRNFHNNLTVRRGLEFVFHFSTLWKWMWQMEIKVKTKTQPFATGQLRRKEWPGGVGQRRRWWWMWVLAQIGFSAGNKVLEGILAITIMPNNRSQYCARFPTLIPFCPLHNTFYQGTQGVGWPASLWLLGRGKATDSTLSTFSLSRLLACSSAHWVEEPVKSRLTCFIWAGLIWLVSFWCSVICNML